jgi:hypothetical protein
MQWYWNNSTQSLRNASCCVLVLYMSFVFLSNTINLLTVELIGILLCLTGKQNSYIIQNSVACMVLNCLSALCQLCFKPSIVWPGWLLEHSILLAIMWTLFVYAWAFFQPHWSNHHQNIFNSVSGIYNYFLSTLSCTCHIVWLPSFHQFLKSEYYVFVVSHKVQWTNIQIIRYFVTSEVFIVAEHCKFFSGNQLQQSEAQVKHDMTLFTNNGHR